MVALASSSSSWTVLPSSSVLARSESASVAPGGDGLRQDLVGEGDELLALGDEVRLAVDLDEGADAVAGRGGHEAVGGRAALTLRDALEALDAKDLDGLGAVAVGLVERLLDVHHAGAGLLAQRLDVSGGVVRHALYRSFRQWRLTRVSGWALAGREQAVRPRSAPAASRQRRRASARSLGGRASAAGRRTAVSAAGASAGRRLDGASSAGASAAASAASVSAAPAGASVGGSGVGVELALPLGQRLLGLRVAAGLAGRALDQAVGDGVGDDPGQQRDGADRVVVAGDLVVDLVGVAVRVEDRDDRQAELAGLVDGEVLLLRVDDPDGRGDLGHRADAAEGALELDPSRA